MEVKKTGNNVNIYDGERLLLHLDKNGDIFTAVNDSVRISAKIEKISDSSTKFSEVSLKKMNSSGKMVKNTSQKWIRHYTTWLESDGLLWIVEKSEWYHYNFRKISYAA